LRRSLPWLAAVGSCIGCRKPAPAERVFTGQNAVRPGAEQDPGGVGTPSGSGGTGGSSDEQSGGALGGSAAVLPTPDVSEPSETDCVPPQASTEPFSKARLLEATADCAVYHYCVFEQSAQALEVATSGYAEAATPASRTRAQQAFLAAMQSWQRAEMFRFGPAARSTEPGGQDLRDLIYAWPVGPECKVDEQTVSRSYATPAFHSLDFTASPVTGRTLNALEYLLFTDAVDNHCSQFTAINASGSWAALSPEDIASRRRAYSAEVAKDVVARSRQLLDAWAPSGGNFRALMLGSGPGNELFTSEQQVLNTVSNAMFYVDDELKDLKLGTPLGITPECTAAACPDAVESTYTDQSIEYIRANVIGFRRLFEGCGSDYSGIGFDDWLRDAGGSDLADRMLTDLAAIEGAIDQASGSLAQTVVNNRERPLAVHAALKAVTDELKTEFVTVLNLELPAAIEGDND
jgi:predicted lipoprotein